MEFKVVNLAQVLDGEIMSTLGKGSILVKINGTEHMLYLLKADTNELEFMLDSSYHYARIVSSNSAETKILIDNQLLIVKRYSKMTEVLEKSLPSARAGDAENILISQIPGRVVTISAKTGASVKKGDVVMVLESMKMQIAVKAHKDGNIKEIKVEEGKTVGRNDVMAIIE
jgi:biotin carboxyl carrier protein